MALASEHHSDLEFMLETYEKWFDSGKAEGDPPVCSTCQNRIPPVLLKKSKGCRPCRIKYSNENGLNNKLMENILSTKESVLNTFNEKLGWLGGAKQENNSKIELREVIGRSLISSFEDQLGEMLFPDNPDVGIHLLDQDAKGLFSSTSVFAQKQQKMYSILVPMKITKIPNGTLIVDQVHPIKDEWIEKKVRDRFERTRKEITRCSFYENLNNRYSTLLKKELRAVEQSKKWANYTIVSYDSNKNTLSVFCPRSDCKEVRNYCDAIISKQKDMDINFPTDLEIADAQIIAKFRSGMKISAIDQSNEFQVQMLINENITTKKEVIDQLCKKHDIKATDVKSCIIVVLSKAKGKLADVSFFNKDIAAKVRSQANLPDENDALSKFSPIQPFAKVIYPGFEKKETLERVLNQLKIKAPIYLMKEQDRQSSTTYSIFINNLPPALASESALALLLPNNLEKPFNISLKSDKKGNPFAILTFSKESHRERAHQYLQSSQSFCQTVMLGGKMYKPSMTLKEGNSLRSEYILLFSNSEDLTKFSLKAKGDSSKFELESGVYIKKTPLQNRAFIEGKLRSLKELRISYSITKLSENHFDVMLQGGNPDFLETIAKKILDSLTPTFATIVGGQQHQLFEEMESMGLLKDWAKKYSVGYKLEQNAKTNKYQKIWVSEGEKIQHALFMGEILNYSDSFKKRFTVQICPKNANFLFKPGRLGHVFLKDLNEEFKNAIVSYSNDENQMNIYIKPKEEQYGDMMNKILEKINKFNQNHFENMPEQMGEQNKENLCVSCSRNPGNPLFICGHRQCEDCLKTLTKESSSKGAALICRCQTPISLKDIKSIFHISEIIEIAKKYLEHSLTSDPNSNIAKCPMENCKFIRQKANGYSVCPKCKTPSCPLCLEKNAQAHQGIKCEEYLEKKRQQGLDFIVKKAVKFLQDNWEYTSISSSFEFEVNPGLELGSPAVQKFAQAVKSRGINLLNNGFFAWHGTSDDAGIIGICHNGFDPKRRSGQSYGPGEYFGQAATTSHAYSKNNNRLIVSYLLNVPETKTCGNYCYVVNNPLDWSLAYNLPVLVVSYLKKLKVPVGFIKEPKKTVELFDWTMKKESGEIPNNDSKPSVVTHCSAFRWLWKEDSGNFKAYMDEINRIIEPKYDEFNQLKGSPIFITPPIIRFIDDKPQEYMIDFKNMIQINMKTKFIRGIQREKTDIYLKKSTWKFLEENGMWKEFESLVLEKLESAFQVYCGGGPGRLNQLSFPGRPETYTIDFINWQQTNELTKKTRKIQREVLLNK